MDFVKISFQRVLIFMISFQKLPVLEQQTAFAAGKFLKVSIRNLVLFLLKTCRKSLNVINNLNSPAVFCGISHNYRITRYIWFCS